MAAISRHKNAHEIRGSCLQLALFVNVFTEKTITNQTALLTALLIVWLFAVQPSFVYVSRLSLISRLETKGVREWIIGRHLGLRRIISSENPRSFGGTRGAYAQSAGIVFSSPQSRGPIWVYSRGFDSIRPRWGVKGDCICPLPQPTRAPFLRSPTSRSGIRTRAPTIRPTRR